MTSQRFLCLTLLISLSISGCGNLALTGPDRKNTAPWERLPEGNGICYVEKLTHDPAVDPLYLAKMTYDDVEALQLVLDTFGLVPRNEKDDESTFTTMLDDSQPTWFPLTEVTDIYVYPARHDEDYVSNLWVNADEKVMILEVWFYDP